MGMNRRKYETRAEFDDAPGPVPAWLIVVLLFVFVVSVLFAPVNDPTPVCLEAPE